ncbi:hypothetical protein COU80_05915 [Candidatus Peregrinibacteria bacterium CG10_big_fil_rev_8_21_14_0_10_55_24]|nr:MAG: hypothetical protein COU80_05915 [Candidatus Peregrinibacteria bacterium CG10_big_fil_rev_8_21_14_0_10_55_24]
MTPFFNLLRDAWALCRERRVSLLIGAIIFGALLVIVQSLTVEFASFQTRRAILNLQVGADIVQEIEEGDDAMAPERMVDALRSAQQAMENMDPAAQEEYMRTVQGQLLQRNLPLALGFGIFTLIFLLWSGGYYLLLATTPERDILKLLQKSGRLLIPLFLLSLRIFLWSFAWLALLLINAVGMWIVRLPLGMLTKSAPVILLIPSFLALILSVLLMAPYAIAPLRLLEGHGVVQSMRESAQSVRGRQLHVGAMFCALLVLLWVVSLLTQTVAQILPLIGALLVGVVGQLELAFAACFLVVLAGSLQRTDSTSAQA